MMLLYAVSTVEGQICTPPETYCQDGCCPATHSICCYYNRRCCSVNYPVCCYAGHCCVSHCCSGGCCSSSYPVCCGTHCCKIGTHCCGYKKCCISYGRRRSIDENQEMHSLLEVIISGVPSFAEITPAGTNEAEKKDDQSNGENDGVPEET